MNRIRFLDGLRGIAILLVIFFHAFSRWPSILPYGDKYASFPVFKYGYLGVQLFFMISGFVILMTLEKSKNFTNFIYKRWLRLFPAMFIASVLVYFTASILHERPEGEAMLINLIPGLLFIEPEWITNITNLPVKSLEAAFWSLYIEVKFYFIFGILYFRLGRDKAILCLFLLFLTPLVNHIFHFQIVSNISNALSLPHFGWFVSGCLAYLFYINSQKKYIVLALAAALIEIASYARDIYVWSFSLFILAVFLTSIYFPKVRFIYENKLFLFLGFISYPLYLIHENAMIALIIKFNKIQNYLPDFLLFVLSVSIFCAFAYLIAKILEPYFILFLKRN